MRLTDQVNCHVPPRPAFGTLDYRLQLRRAYHKFHGIWPVLSADKRLVRVARAEGLDALNIETDEEQITNRFN